MVVIAVALSFAPGFNAPVKHTNEHHYQPDQRIITYMLKDLINHFEIRKSVTTLSMPDLL